MQYHDKARDMARSILPSSARKSARENLAGVKRNARRNLNQRLHQLRFEDYDDADDFDFMSYPNGEISEAVGERRQADKVAPAIRWAEAVVADVPRSERLTFLEAVFPNTLAGQHALYGHIYNAEAFDQGHPNRRYWRRPERLFANREEYLQYEAKRKRSRSATNEYRVALDWLREYITRPGGHKRFNNALKGFADPPRGHARQVLVGFREPDPEPSDTKDWGYFSRAIYEIHNERCPRCPTQRRMLLGIHDIETWWADTRKFCGGSEYRAKLLEFYRTNQDTCA